MNVLITYGSKMGGTGRLADLMAAALKDLGVDAEVHPVFLADHVEDYDAVVVGSALYMQRWRRDARRFVERNTDLLRDRPVFFFSSGPLDDGATKRVIPPTKQVDRLMRRVGGVGHTTFGGQLAEDASGLVAHAMAKDEHAGDWLDRDQVNRWAQGVAAYLNAHPHRVGA